jgi:UDP-N-acetylmuramate--alanine ligase
MIQSINDFRNPFFIGIAGTGMSALAQYLNGCGKTVSGSDRYFIAGEENDTKTKLEAEGIACFLQDGSGITPLTDVVIASTAVEDTVVEMIKAREMNIPVLRRSELLALISQSKKTIAVGGTSGKSTTSAMLFDILQHAGLEPGIISGAGLVNLIQQGKIGNAMVGKGEWLVIEADESDGSIVQYHPEIGIVLNVDKDHKELDVLMEVFTTFKNNSKQMIVNQSHPLARKLSQQLQQDFSTGEENPAGFMATGFQQKEFAIQFSVNGNAFSIPVLGKHNMENAVSAIATAMQIGVRAELCAEALANYKGIYRRHQVLGKKNGVWLIDDYAHNPVKCAASIAACQPVAEKVVAWFQPHGYGPTKFLRNDFVQEIAAVLRPQDEIWMSEIFYAGGTAIKDISAEDLVNDIKVLGKNAFFVAHRDEFVKAARAHLTEGSVLLLMGARDPGLELFAQTVFHSL